MLAEDPVAGKTIMAGLYIKELMLRRPADVSSRPAAGGGGALSRAPAAVRASRCA